jgi:hypothetical protein
MKRVVSVLVACVALGLWIAAAESGDHEHKHGEHGHKHGAHGHEHGEHSDMKPVPISPEHRRLHALVGHWNIEHRAWHEPGGEPVVSRGTEVVTAILDGRALLSEVETRGPAGVFNGHGMTTWNMAKQKYQYAWLDLYSYNGIDSGWGTYDAETDTYTWRMETTSPDGHTTPMRGVHKIVSDDEHVASYFMRDESGGEFKMMEIVCHRAN